MKDGVHTRDGIGEGLTRSEGAGTLIDGLGEHEFTESSLWGGCDAALEQDAYDGGQIRRGCERSAGGDIYGRRDCRRGRGRPRWRWGWGGREVAKGDRIDERK